MNEIIKITITQEPQSPPFGDYDILYAYGVDKEHNYYELVFTDENGKAGRLESVKNCYTSEHIDPLCVEVLHTKGVKHYGKKENKFFN